MHGNANIIVVMSDKQQPKNAFVREQIKDKPKNYKRMWVGWGICCLWGVYLRWLCVWCCFFMIPVLRQEEGSVPDTGAQDSQQASVEETEQGSEERRRHRLGRETADDARRLPTDSDRAVRHWKYGK